MDPSFTINKNGGGSSPAIRYYDAALGLNCVGNGWRYGAIAVVFNHGGRYRLIEQPNGNQLGSLASRDLARAIAMIAGDWDWQVCPQGHFPSETLSKWFTLCAEFNANVAERFNEGS